MNDVPSVCKQAAEHNLVIIAAALRECGLEGATVDFDGYGDSVDSMEVSEWHATEVKEGEDYTKVPAMARDHMVEGLVNVRHKEGGGRKIVPAEPASLQTAVLHTVWDSLMVSNAGWENGAGGFGTATIDEKGLTLEMNHRSVEYDEETFTAQALEMEKDTDLPEPTPS